MTELQILEQAAGIVHQAGEDILLPAFRQTEFTLKSDNSVVTATDHNAQTFIRNALAAAFPGIKLLGEEMDASTQIGLLQAADEYLWCLDPLDGTTNFAMGVPYFAISLALLRNKKAIMGIVYDPLRQECFSAIAGQGAWLNGERLASHPVQSGMTMANAIALVDFKRLQPALAARLATAAPYRSQRSFGSVALDWCWLAAGRGQLYLHGKQRLWDFAAGSLVAAQAGAFRQTLEGEFHEILDLEPRSVLAAMDATLFAQWRDFVTGNYDE